jgi:hypothetical protein
MINFKQNIDTSCNYRAITSLNQSYYNMIGHKMLETFSNFFPVNISIYSEDMSADVDISKNIELNNFLDDLGESRARGFAYKAFSIIDSLDRDFDRLIYLDADLICFRPMSIDFINNLMSDELVTYIGVTNEKFGSHSDSCFFILNKLHPFFSKFADEYKRVYYSRDILNSDKFVKPNDSYVLAHCINYAEQNGHKCRDLHPERTGLSPVKETVLGSYLRHFKASGKFNPKMLGHIDKAINALKKGKDVDKTLELLDRRLRRKDDLH